MKNMILACMFTFLGMGLYAQEGFRIGIQGGIPLEEYNDLVGVVVGLDAKYMWVLGEGIDLGIATGFINGFPEKFQTGTVIVDLPNVQFVPVTGSIRVWPSNSISLGGDVGQAIGLNDGNDGGLYYRPQIGYLMSSKTEVNVSYTRIELDIVPWSMVTLGVLVML